MLSFDPAALSADQRIDRELVLMTLRRRAILRDWEGWRRDAESYLEPALGGVFNLFLHRLRPDAELARSAIARLAALPDLLAAARANLEPDLAAPELVRRAVAQARGGVGYLRDWLPAEAPDCAPLGDAARTAADQVAAHADWLAAFAERAGGSFMLGEARYSALLREAEGLGYGATELHQRGRAAFRELADRLTAAATDLDGSPDWGALLDRLNADAPPTLAAMRAEYAAATERARAFCADRELVTLPAGERCLVIASPPQDRPVLAVAYYVESPPLSRGRVGHFFVPYTPDGSTAEQVRQRLASNSRMKIPTTAVHEAYPGHHWHLAWMSAICSRPIRTVFSSHYFTEGWALYAEQLLADEGFFCEPAARVGQLEARLFRAARMVVDPALHTGELTATQAARYLVENVRMPPETAAAEVVRYCAWPTQAPSYLTGALEIERMRDQWLAGGGNLREFHDRLAGSGMLPLGLAERALAEA